VRRSLPGLGGLRGLRGLRLSIQADTDEESERLFGLLADRGEVRMPLRPSFLSSKSGSVTDRFGISWMVLTAPAETPAAATAGAA
jgi:PhnB protein